MTRKKTDQVDAPQITVTGPKGGRWRAGRHFTPEATRIALSELSRAVLKALKDDPALSVEAADPAAKQ